MTAKCFLLFLPDLGFLPVAHNCPDSPPGATGLPGQAGSKGPLCLLSQQNYSECPPTGQGGPRWPLSDTATLSPSLQARGRVGIEAGSGVVLCDQNSPPGRPALCSFLATVPADIHFCFPLPSCSSCPGAGAKGRPRPSPRDPAPGHPSTLSGALNTGLPTFRGAHSTHGPRPPTSAPDTRPNSVLTKSSPQSQRGIEVPPQKPTCEGA